MGIRQPNQNETPINQQVYRSIVEPDERRRRDREERQRRTIEVVSILFGVGLIVMLLIAGASWWAGL